MIFEIRDYHYRPDLFDAYKAWAEKAVPVLRAELDLVGFWIDRGTPPEIQGAAPVESPIGQANITWILRWESQEARAERFGKLFQSDAWKSIWSEHPDPDGYVQTTARFMDAM